jgi:hypothetical protein
MLKSLKIISSSKSALSLAKVSAHNLLNASNNHSFNDFSTVKESSQEVSEFNKNYLASMNVKIHYIDVKFKLLQKRVELMEEEIKDLKSNLSSLEGKISNSTNSKVTYDFFWLSAAIFGGSWIFINHLQKKDELDREAMKDIQGMKGKQALREIEAMKEIEIIKQFKIIDDYYHNAHEQSLAGVDKHTDSDGHH